MGAVGSALAYLSSHDILTSLNLGRNVSDTSALIDASRYFTFIYGLYPCNTVAFLRRCAFLSSVYLFCPLNCTVYLGDVFRPIMHLQDLGFDSPFTVPWRDILDVDEIRSKSKVQ